MSTMKNGKVIITQEDIDRIIKPPKSREEAIRLSKKYEDEYERSKQEIIDIMRKNIELYSNVIIKEQDT